MTDTSFRLSAGVAAVAYAVCGAGVIGHPVPDDHWGTRGAVVDAAGAIAFLFTAVALTAFAAAVSAGSGGRRTTQVAQAGLGAMTIESVASLLHGGNTLGPLFVVGLLLSLGGLVAVAFVGLRAGRARWASALPAVGLLVGIAGGDHGGFLATGVIWAVLAVLVDMDRVGAAGIEPATTSL